MSSEVTLKVGGRHFDPKLISPSDGKKRVLVEVRGKSEEVGFYQETIDRIEEDGRSAIRRMVGLHSQKLGDQATKIVVDAITLEPLSFEGRADDLLVSAQYGKGRITGYRKRGNQRQFGGGLEIPQDAFDASSIELLLRAVELGPGWAARLNVCDVMASKIARVHLSVTGTETVQGQECWVVKSDAVKRDIRYWISKNDSEIVVQEFSPKKGTLVRFF